MNRMIGYRLKRLDRLIDDTFDRLLADTGLSRRQWQVLNTLSRTACDDEQLDEALRPFWDGGAETVADVVDELGRRGWLADDGGRHALTEAGRTAHAAAGDRVAGIRALMSEGVTAEEFQATMEVLQRMADNLAAARR
ncbi:DNA-binding MarR family transcriptional regulator [Nonomuraea africana]|uniref:DNA-binding MarR family transcriptional regulator n=2 Tax=Nonomuraea africana TaxID=46171 RepID=A0ABR9KWP1_9ACTN|nr:DNA-binding MarR family transcriptional regulator [Nonomuraea africana]